MYRDDGTLTFPEVKSRPCIRIVLLPVAASGSEWQYILPEDKVNGQTTPVMAAMKDMDRKCLIRLLSHSRKQS